MLTFSAKDMIDTMVLKWMADPTMKVYYRRNFANDIMAIQKSVERQQA
jgi:hypothetical protein